MPNANKFKKLYCLLIKCQMCANKGVQNSDKIQFDPAKERKPPKVFIFQTLFSHSTVFFL